MYFFYKLQKILTWLKYNIYNFKNYLKIIFKIQREKFRESFTFYKT